MYEDRIKWIEHKGKRILSLDYSNLPSEDLTPMQNEVARVVTKEPPNSVVYLTDVSNFKFSMKTLNQFNQLANVTKPHDKIVAILGATGLIKVMYDGYAKLFGKPIRAFNSRE